jgi:hypothetical protein
MHPTNWELIPCSLTPAPIFNCRKAVRQLTTDSALSIILSMNICLGSRFQKNELMNQVSSEKGHNLPDPQKPAEDCLLCLLHDNKPLNILFGEDET